VEYRVYDYGAERDFLMRTNGTNGMNGLNGLNGTEHISSGWKRKRRKRRRKRKRKRKGKGAPDHAN
jgi:hypothetical protein